jgi:hypothetical protein
VNGEAVCFLCDRCGNAYKTSTWSPICAGCVNGLAETLVAARKYRPRAARIEGSPGGAVNTVTPGLTTQGVAKNE